MNRIALALVLTFSSMVPGVERAGAASAGAASPSPDLDAVAIYRRCVAAMARTPAPPYAYYVLQINSNRLDLTRGYADDGHPTMMLHFMVRPHANTYRVWYRFRDTRALMQDMASSSRTITPPVPWALSFHHSKAAMPTGASGSEVGESGVELDSATELADKVESDDSAFYTISLTGLIDYQGHPAYDLALRNVAGDPNGHPLRELIVDRRSFRIWQLALELGRPEGALNGSLQVRASFRPVGRYWLNDAGTLVGEGHVAFMRFRGSYDYTATQFRFPRDMPDSYFQAPDSAQHQVLTSTPHSL